MVYSQLKISGPVIMIEDDEDDQFIFDRIFQELHVADSIIYFLNPVSALQYLKTQAIQPFVIISDVNLPMQSGIEFKRQIDNDPYLRSKSIPFIFLSTSVDRILVDKAYKELTIQGFFQKSDDYEQLKQNLYLILCYWQVCKHPNSI